ncbi:hypothetical protein AGMMS49545_19730 [Betaproteobacteria bacterium]|nr:hypothetical protein AGMMS49545_19730 [Betaproteobacteria bacterium]GHU46779.1 hypothetical protein AGMMS50289_20930 [Betaproteobacteria bacterium]
MPEKFTLQPLLELMQERTDEATRQLGQLTGISTFGGGKAAHDDCHLTSDA